MHAYDLGLTIYSYDCLYSLPIPISYQYPYLTINSYDCLYSIPIYTHKGWLFPRLKLRYHFFNSQKIPQIKTSCQKKHWKCNIHKPGLLNQSMSSPSIERSHANSIIQKTIPYLQLDQYSS